MKIGSNFESQRLQNLAAPSIGSNQGMKPEPPPPDGQNQQAFQSSLSSLAKILSTLRDDESTSREQVKSYLDELKMTMSSGNVSAAELAESAPDWLVSAAESGGVDMNTLFSELIDRAASGMNGLYGPGAPPEKPMGPPPEMMNSAIGQLFQQAQESGSTDEEGIRSFMDSVREAQETGSTDAASLAESAPDWLKAAAERSGVDLESAITDMMENAPPRPPERPAGPFPGMTETQLGQLLQQVDESDETDKEEIISFVDSLIDQINDGSADVSSLISSAPEWLTTAADNSGSDLGNVFSNFISWYQTKI